MSANGIKAEDPTYSVVDRINIQKCSKCIQTYHPSTLRPFALSCGHSFCFSCITQMSVRTVCPDNVRKFMVVVSCSTCTRRNAYFEGHELFPNFDLIKAIEVSRQLSAEYSRPESMTQKHESETHISLQKSQADRLYKEYDQMRQEVIHLRKVNKVLEDYKRTSELYHTQIVTRKSSAASDSDQSTGLSVIDGSPSRQIPVPACAIDTPITRKFCTVLPLTPGLSGSSLKEESLQEMLDHFLFQANS